MGTFEKGILGPFRGTIGTVIGGSWKGISYMRSKPPRKRGSSTLKQQQQQVKFGLIIRFLQTMKDLLAVGFRDYSVNMSGFNSAFSYNIKNAVTGTYPDYRINYPLVLISRGDLFNGGAPTAQAAPGSKVNFTWQDNSGMGKAVAGDHCVAVVYCPELNLTAYNMNAGLRGEKSASIEMEIFKGKEVHAYISFISADESEVATSLYLGALTVL